MDTVETTTSNCRSQLLRCTSFRSRKALSIAVMTEKAKDSIAILTSIIEDTKKHIGSKPANEAEENEDPQRFQTLVAETHMQMYGQPVPQGEGFSIIKTLP